MNKDTFDHVHIKVIYFVFCKLGLTPRLLIVSEANILGPAGHMNMGTFELRYVTVILVTWSTFLKIELDLENSSS